MTTKYILLPNVEQFRPQIENYASKLVHGQVSIQSIETKWNKANPYIKLNNIKIKDETDKTVLNIPNISTVVSWRSLIELKPVFLGFEAKELLLDISRDHNNKITVMGQPINTDINHGLDNNFETPKKDQSSNSTINNAMTWLFEQSQVVIKESKLQWHDIAKVDHPLILQNVNLRISNNDSKHLFNLEASSNVNTNASLEIRSYINRQNHHFDIDKITGTSYVHINGLSPKKWQPWIDWQGYFDTDKTSAQAWININNGKATELTADISMENANWLNNNNHEIQAEKIKIFATTKNENGLKLDALNHVDLQFQADNMNLWAKDLYKHAINIKRISADTRLEIFKNDTLSIKSDNLSIKNDDIHLKTAFNWNNKNNSHGYLDLDADIMFAKISSAYKYLPENIDPDVPEWVTPALKQGIVENGKITFKGNINDLPFEPIEIDNKAPHPNSSELSNLKNIFLITAPFKNAVLDYAPSDKTKDGWPFVYDIQGQVRFQGDDITVFANSAKIAAHKNAVVKLNDVKAIIKDLSGNTTLTIDGNANGDANSYFDFARVSPLSKQLENVFDNTTASGIWDMPLTLKMPIRGEFDVDVAGSIAMQNTSIKFDHDIPEFTNTSGNIIFTNDIVKTKNIKGHLINHAITIDGSIGVNQPGLELNGILNSQTINSLYPSAISNKISGQTAYKARLSGLMASESHPPRLIITSNLQGLELDLPQPLNKNTNQKLPLEVKWNYGNHPRSRVLSIVVANIVNASFIRNSQATGTSYFDSAYLAVNSKLKPPQKGMIIDVVTEELNISKWLEVLDQVTHQENNDYNATSISNIFPNLDKLSILTNSVYLFNKNLGTLNLVSGLESGSKRWLIKQLELNNLYMQASGSGELHTSKNQQGLELNLQAHVNDLGSYFDQLGIADALSQGQGEITANIHWKNLPWEFNYEDLTGLVTFNLKDGRINAKKSHTVRLLELLSLQSFNRLATLDYNPKDIGKDGFPYQTLMGTLQFDNGNVTTKDYKISGPIATIVIDGLSNLSNNTLDLNAVVIPNLDVSGAAIATAIAVNPAIGLGAFVTQWLLKAPLGKAMAVQYKINGTWNDPKIESSKDLK